MSELYGTSPNLMQNQASPTQSTEKSVKSCYAVVYELKNRKWAVSGEGGWSEVHLCMDTLDNSHRILAWTVKNQHVLMNCNVTGECSYKEKSKNFHSFTDENNNRFGLGFHKSESGLRQAQHFLNAVVGVIKMTKNLNMNDFSLGASPSPGPSITSSQGNNSVGPPPNPFQKPINSNINKKQPNSPRGKPLPPNPNNLNSNGHVNQNRASYSKPPQKKLPTTPPPNPHQVSHTSFSKPKSPPPNPHSKSPKQSNSYQQPPPAFGLPKVQINSYNSSNSNGTGLPKPSNSGGGLPSPSFQSSGGGGLPKTNNIGGGGLPKANHKVVLRPPKGIPSPNKPQSPHQSTTEQVALSPVSAAVSDENSNGRFVPPTKRSIGNVQELPSYHLSKVQTKSLPSQPIGTLGSLKILPPKQNKLDSGDKKIENPDNVEHTMRVTHDKDTGKFHGLPQEWMDVLNKQFGVAPRLLPSQKLDEYEHKIPKVLISLRRNLEKLNAYEQVGIFRLAPNATDNRMVKATIDKGKFESEEKVDCNVYANLIKVWFRDLPDPLLNCVSPDAIEMVRNEDDVVKLINKFPDPQKSIFMWLCDMCVDVARYEKTNKMSPQNLAIVIGPNLFNTDSFENPMKAMTFSGKVVQFFKLAIEWRRKQTG